jgi:toxin ParE1/3/4
MSEKKLLEWSIRSSINVVEINDYLIGKNPVAAKRVLDEIRLVANEIRDFPMIGRAGRRRGTRELVLPHYPYTLIYRLTEIKVLIVAVVHQSRQNS